MNNYTIMNARLVADPRTVKIGKTDLTEARVADNPRKKLDGKGRKRKARFVTLKFFGKLAPLAAKLSKGDIVAPTGSLEIDTYEKDGAEVDKDVLVVNDFFVVKSDTFFGGEQKADEAPAGGEDIPF